MPAQQAPTGLISARAVARYTIVAVILHWVIALGILALLAMGLTMTHASLAPMRTFQLYQLHKSVGITVLLAAVLRLLWRLRHAPPAMPAATPVLEKRAAHGMHAVLYGFILMLPLTGWAVASASPFNIPTVLYGLVRWPHLPWLATLQHKAPVEAILVQVHAYGAWILIGLVLVHAGAALRHHFVQRDDILWRMLPLFRRPSMRSGTSS